MAQRHMKLGLPEIAAQLGVLTAEARDRFVARAPFVGTDRKFAPEPLDGFKDIDTQCLLRLDSGLDPGQDAAKLGQQHQRW
jgi:hypothetical protein